MTRPATMKVTYTPISEQLKLISSCPWMPAEPCAEEWCSLYKNNELRLQNQSGLTKLEDSYKKYASKKLISYPDNIPRT